MPEITFQQLTTLIQGHFANETFADGLSLASQHITDFPEEFALLNYWRVCLAARMGDPSIANKILDYTLSNGTWFSEMLLRESPSLAPLQGDVEFERLVEISLQMKAADPIQAVPVLVMRPENECGPEDPGCPTVVFLHANQDTAKNNLGAWQDISNDGWLVALPQSSQAMWADSFVWMNYESGRDEVVARFNELKQQYSLDPNQTLMAGFSMGAEVALAMDLSGDIETQGFLLLGPGGPSMDDLEKWEPFIEKGKKEGLRGVILMGLADIHINQDNVRKLVEMLNGAGIPTELKTYPGLKHDYPEDFTQAVEEAIKFIYG